jgi:type I restriction enzyme S subunit
MKTGWQTTTLGDICQLESGKPLAEDDRRVAGPYPVYGADGEIGRTDKYYFDKPSVIVGRKGTVGELNLTEKRFWPLDDTYFVTFDEEQYDLQFLFHLLVTVDLHSFAKGAKRHINRNEVYAQAVKVPVLAEQQRIGSILDTALSGIELAHANTVQNLQNARALFEGHLQSIFIQRLESLYRRKLAALDELKQSLLRQAFGGEL